MLKSVVLSLSLVSLVACNQATSATPPARSTAEQDADFVRMVSAGRMLPDLQTYLESKEPAPRTFGFDRLNFDPGSSTVRPVDEQTIYALANALQKHANARVGIVGYDDGQRTRSRNLALGRQRAVSVVLALRKAGVESSRLEASAGREVNGARVSELVVLQK